MFIEFNPLALIFWIFLSSFVPGTLLFLGLSKDDKKLNLLEKVLCGFGIGFIIPAFIPFMLFAVFGITYSYGIAWLSIIIFYMVSIFLFVKTKAYEEIKQQMAMPKLDTFDWVAPYMTGAFLVVILFLSFWIRVQPSSPIFYEFDPYFYLYTAQQILVDGYNPVHDGTAWYPEVMNDHRAGGTIEAYMESIWYSLYTGGGEYNNYLLALIAGYYPPIAAAFTVFFLYLIVATSYKREYALIGATIASFIPIFLQKFSAGEMEVQPYAFLTLTMFFGFYIMAINDKKIKFALLAGISYAALAIGTASSVVALTALLIFVPLYSVALFFRGKEEEFKEFLIINAIIVIVGILLLETGLTVLFRSANVINRNLIIGLTILAISGALYVIKQKVKDFETSIYILGGLFVLGLALVAFTPLGNTFKDMASGSLGIATYSTSLQRTIAEQGTTGAFFEGQLGFIGGSLPQPLDLVLIVPSYMTNFAIDFVTDVAAYLTGVDIRYTYKEPSILFTLICLFLLAIAYALYRLVKGDRNYVLLYAALIIPIAIVGIIKAKYTIYLGILFVGLLGIVLGEVERALVSLLRKLNITKDEMALKIPFYVLLVLGISMAIAQYGSSQEINSLLLSSFKTKFQDNPLALQSKFSFICSQLKLQGAIDTDVCGAAEDPMGYASQGTNYQYNQKLCALSHYANPLTAATDEENREAGLRCRNMNDYWVETMEWIRYNTEQNSRTTSWWDYGHWINFFGQRNTVLRNEHSSLPMILEVAHDYIDGSPEELAAFMKAHDSKYALFDSEILLGGNSFGGKYGALNYLSCARDNQTSVLIDPGASYCEGEHLWQQVYVPVQKPEQCQISKDKIGVVAYDIEHKLAENGGRTDEAKRTYCIGLVQLIDGKNITGTYDLNQKYENGDLKINKAFLQDNGQTSDGLQVFSLIYTKDKVWLDNGELKDGYEDRKGKFYDSNLYKAFILEDLPGFELVFKSKGGEVKIYKIKE